ncbi:Chromosome partitioning ATPase, Mrp family, contains Fe-S cluster [Salipiger thiooxidans]|uniref:Chromosome partitioning ATPase, Mrp family, contains Fe-S cluster n=1 Tax=Salipiger thiooxidans TaxID=282683 RepID=A0A1G7E1G2_9RHOB|nr:CpsD/CapB family tyrosine-protein kinase [Salipiger thiooxidans]SDE57330.1 Chromosome partitioning ATPase, Mrp family, contains Fe-S cluster [Salipiger thiooxidans]
MDKLQAAIAQARQQRTAGIAPGIRLPTDKTQAWDALASFTPDPKHLERNRIAVNTRGPARAALDLLRTRLLELAQKNSWKRVMITSPTPGCGKTTVSAGLALAIQRQVERRSVLMDLDQPRSGLGRALGLRPEHDVTELLSGGVTAAEQMYRIGGNLAVSASAKGHNRDSELLKSSRARDCIDEIERTFAPDIMLFDSPPFFVSDDAMAAAHLMDCVIIVGAAEQTTIAEIDATERELSQHCNIAGVVLNKCRFGIEHSNYDYH